MKRIFAPFIMGQFGYVFSMGMVYLSSKVKALGLETALYTYGSYERVRSDIRYKRANGYAIAGFGF